MRHRQAQAAEKLDPFRDLVDKLALLLEMLVEEQVQLVWRQRQTSVNFIVRNVNVESGSQDSSFQAFQVVIRRSF